MVNALLLMNFQTALSRMVRQNLVSGNQLLGLGIWNLNTLALKR